MEKLTKTFYKRELGAATLKAELIRKGIEADLAAGTDYDKFALYARLIKEADEDVETRKKWLEEAPEGEGDWVEVGAVAV